MRLEPAVVVDRDTRTRLASFNRAQGYPRERECSTRSCVTTWWSSMFGALLDLPGGSRTGHTGPGGPGSARRSNGPLECLLDSFVPTTCRRRRPVCWTMTPVMPEAPKCCRDCCVAPDDFRPWQGASRARRRSAAPCRSIQLRRFAGAGLHRLAGLGPAVMPFLWKTLQYAVSINTR